MTNEGKRNPSRVEFDNTYFAIDDDIQTLISHKFYLDEEALRKRGDYLERKMPLLEELSQALFLHLKFANSLYPTCKRELEERRMHQKYAAGACYGIVSLYERIFHYVGISADKHTEEIQHIRKELNSIKSWRESDAKRFKF